MQDFEKDALEKKLTLSPFENISKTHKSVEGLIDQKTGEEYFYV